ncbi:MAG: hypothetical protein J3Q66DRAFT_335138 [Benniella sp.]|nr:MAG: hypothetical protein J3Q66DRAFT_335138 [Benniella sp.]
MRFQTIVACVVVALASSSSMVAAQADMPPAACSLCVANVFQSYSACNIPNYSPSDADNPGEMNAAELKCFCTIISGDWSNKCSSECGADYVRLMTSAYGDMRRMYCSGVNTAGSSASTVKACSSVAMALGAAFAQALL